jgi:hypothetical protein
MAIVIPGSSLILSFCTFFLGKYMGKNIFFDVGELDVMPGGRAARKNCIC